MSLFIRAEHWEELDEIVKGSVTSNFIVDHE